MEPSRRRTAWHEAGHAVVAWAQNFTVVLVSIRPAEDGSFGRLTHGPAGDCTIPSERERENIVAMGGWAAEHASGEAVDTTYDGGDVACLLSRAPEGRVEIELGWAEQEAERIVRSNLDRVERLAAALLERAELTDAAEIKAIIEGSR
jgi:ATP-dependent Zn protease